MSTPVYVVGSVEYLKVRVSSDVDLDTQLVEIRLDGVWRTAAWVGDVAKVRIAEVIIDFTSVAVAAHTVYVRIHDSPEVPILNAGRISVRA